MNSAIDARGTTMSMMSSAPAAFATQNAFSRASMSCGAALPAAARTRRCAPSSASSSASACDVLVEPVVAAVLQHDDEVGERLLLDVVGDAELEPDVRRVIAAIVIDVDVLEDQRTDAAGDDLRAPPR